jgi:hypothetical protein
VRATLGRIGAAAVEKIPAQTFAPRNVARTNKRQQPFRHRILSTHCELNGGAAAGRAAAGRTGERTRRLKACQRNFPAAR